MTSAQYFATNPIGDIQLTEKHWTITYNMSLVEYLNESELLNECTSELINICTNHTNLMCDYFKNIATRFKNDMLIDKEKWNHLKKTKRSSPEKTWASTILDILFGETSRETLLQMKQILILNSHYTEILGNVTQVTLTELQYLNEYMNSTTDRINNALSDIISTSNQDRNLFNVMQVITLTMFQHQNLQRKLNNIYSGNTNMRLLEIINFVDFSQTVESINLKLSNENKKLPPIAILSSNKFYEISHSFENDYI